ncbi:hypothetical protein [Shewanella livingstonensis]|uniref:Uncharacterized protein n=1 Tax=Shewanella livingstonensis TaxID=150120 RepID=A0A3G8LQT1_9GAMM|nr:hypothetical protein [Shewanella livingstonensis]AZG71911.1 hypothetical protein EGC82_03510 [Shewanella livingstonensis]
MKLILIVILVAIALYLYRRTQAVAKQELDKTDRNTTGDPSSTEVVQSSSITADDTTKTDAEPHTIIDTNVDTTAAHSVDVDKLDPIVLVDEPKVSVESIIEPVETVKIPAEPIDTPKPQQADSLQIDEITEPERAPDDIQATIDISKADLVNKADAVSQVEVKIKAIENVTAEVFSYQGQPLNLDSVEGDWASESFIQQVNAANNASELTSQHDGLVNVINHCYKMRKQNNYCQYGAALQLTYLEVYRALHQQYMTQKSTDEIKSPAFMPLSTLLNDVGQFDEAVKVCQQALEYQLTDGTVTGYEGRIKRIEKAKAKVS